jgi:hypothetical protein
MSTIEQVRTAEKRVKRALEALKNAPQTAQSYLADELAKATDEYARLIQEINAR